jgi:hypothetical protein
MERAGPPRPEGKPSNWWAYEREPWRRVSAEIADEDGAQRAALFRARTAALPLATDAQAEAAREAAMAVDWE